MAGSFQGSFPYRNLDVQPTPVQIQQTVGRGVIVGGLLTNQAASARFLRFWDKATAPVVGTDTPILTIALPANWVGPLVTQGGVMFFLGMWISASTLIADNDATAPTAHDVVANLWYGVKK